MKGPDFYERSYPSPFGEGLHKALPSKLTMLHVSMSYTICNSIFFQLRHTVGDNMNISKFLAKSLGIYLIIVCFAFFIDKQRFIHITQSLVSNEPLMFVTGFFTLILGILMIIGHQIWQFNWRLIITLIGWLIFIKGAFILLYPPYMQTLTAYFARNDIFANITLGIDLILGLILCYYGFRHKVE